MVFLLFFSLPASFPFFLPPPFCLSYSSLIFMLLHFGPPGTPEEPGGHRHTRCFCRLLLRALLRPPSLSEPPVPSVIPVWSESEQKRWTQPPWRPADWVQIPAPAWQSVAFQILGESSDKRADDQMQGGSPSMLAERASTLEADVLSDC